MMSAFLLISENKDVIELENKIDLILKSSFEIDKPIRFAITKPTSLQLLTFVLNKYRKEDDDGYCWRVESNWNPELAYLTEGDVTLTFFWRKTCA